MTAPVLLDLFGCEGGAAAGYALAGFEVWSVDNDPRRARHNPHTWFVGDWADGLATAMQTGRVQAVHASPPCQAHSALRVLSDNVHADLIDPVRQALTATGLPWIMENVPGAPLRHALTLCGSEFGLGAHCADGQYRQLRRHRLFEANRFLWGAGGCHHQGQPVGVYGHGGGGQQGRGYKATATEARQALGLSWATLDGLSQALPPAYTRFLGEQLLTDLAVAA